MRKKTLLTIVSLQVVTIIALAIYVYVNKNKTAKISINSISKSSQIFPKVDNFNFFYEPAPNTNQIVYLKWMGLNYNVNNLINADGLNQLSNYSILKPESVYRIITLGDSFTYGQNVNTKDNYPSQLEKKLNYNLKCKNISKIQVINLGVGGYDISYSVERYKLKGKKYNPDLILWLFDGDDLYRINEKLIPKSLKNLSDEKASGEYQKLIKNGIYYKAWTDAENYIINGYGGKDAMLEIAAKNLIRINDFYNGPLVAITFPYPITDQGSLNTIKNFIDQHGHSYFFNGLTNIWQEKLSLPDGHPSTKGYAVIVDDVYNFLTKNDIIPCQKS